MPSAAPAASSISEAEEAVFAGSTTKPAGSKSPPPRKNKGKGALEPTKQSVLAMHHARSQTHSVCSLTLLISYRKNEIEALQSPMKRLIALQVPHRENQRNARGAKGQSNWRRMLKSSVLATQSYIVGFLPIITRYDFGFT
jgi:hypothetical protein